MKKLASLAIILAVLFTFAAAAQAMTVAVIYADTVEDKGWCQAMDTGIKNAIANGYDIDYTPVESVDVADVANTLDQLAGSYDVIIAHGSQFVTACAEVAEQYPEQCFAAGTTDQILGDNVFTYMPQSEEPGYINGIIAGMTTKTNKVGIIGPIDTGDAARYVRGFIMGLASVNPECEYTLSWTGSFSDTAGASTYAQAMIESNCDVLVGPSQQAIGGIRAANDAEGVTWIGQTLSQLEDFPEIVPAAADYDYSAVLIAIMDNLDNGVIGGACLPMNYNNHGFVFSFSENAELMSEEVKAAAEAAIEGFTAEAGTVDYTSIVLE